MNPKLVSNICDVARSRLVSINVEMLLLDVAKTLSDTQISLVAVCDLSGTMAGIITKTNIVRWIGRCQGDSCSVTAGEVMTSNVVYCRPSDSLPELLSMMQNCGFVHLPILDENHKPLGVINARDALRALFADEKYEESLLRDYVMGIGYR